MIYGIFSGEYSDWYCHGYFETKEEAVDYCDKLNAKYECDNYYIKVLYNLADGSDKDCPKAYRYFAVTGKWERSEYDDDSILSGCDPTVYCGNSNGREVVIVFATDDDAYKVPKIAQDAIAKWKARKEGL